MHSADRTFDTIRRTPALAVAALLFLLLPLYRAAILEDSFITPKLALIQFVLLFFWLPAILLQRSRPNGGVNALDLLVAAWMAITALSATYARSRALALGANSYFLTFGGLYYAARCTIRTPRHAHVLLLAGVTAAVGTALWTIFEDATQGHLSGVVARLPDWRGHLAAGLGNSGHIAGIIGLFLTPAVLMFLRAPKFSVTLLLAIAIMGAGLVITWSVGSTGSTALSAALWIAIAAWKWRGCGVQWKRLWILAAAAIIVAAFYFLPHPLNPHSPSLFLEAFGSDRWKAGGVTRWVIWLTTVHMIQASPALGVGAGNFTLEYVRQIVPAVHNDPALRPYAGAFTNDAHNEYLQLWAELGLPGLLIFLALAAIFFVRIRRALSSPAQTPDATIALLSAGAGITMFLLDSLMTFPVRLPAHFGAFMLFLAIPECASESSESSWGRKAWPVWTLCFLLTLFAASIHARRVAAEYYLKRARTTADTVISFAAGAPQGIWATADGAMNQATFLLSRGRAAEANTLLALAKETALSDEMQPVQADLQRSLAADPAYTNASSRYGSLLLMQGRYGDAAAVLERTLLGLEGSEIHERLGLAYYLLMQKDKARAHWTLCHERRPFAAELYTGLLRQLP